MTLLVTWSDRASADLDEILAYIDQFDSAAASRLGWRLRRAADSLATFPKRGHRRGKTRRWSNVYPYVIRYRVCGDIVEILRIYHGARNVRSPRPSYVAEPA